MSIYLIGTIILSAGSVFLLSLPLLQRLGKSAQELRKEQEEGNRATHHILQPLTKRLSPWLSENFREYLRTRIMQAGGLAGLTPAEMVLFGLVALMMSVALSAAIMVFVGGSFMLILAGFGVGIVFPFIWLRDQVKKRHDEIFRDLPYHIDLLTLCVEAGLDFGAGVARTVEKGRDGALRDELSTFMAEIRMGKTRVEAMQRMGERVGLPVFSAFLGALIQADRMGSGLGRTLRLQSTQLRNMRFQRAEKAAGEAPVKMLIPLVLFVFPTIWIILAAPLIFEWVFKGVS